MGRDRRIATRVSAHSDAAGGVLYAFRISVRLGAAVSVLQAFLLSVDLEDLARAYFHCGFRAESCWSC